MKQQTAIEWLVEQIKRDQTQKALSATEWMQVIEQAKQMEKEQIMQSYNDGKSAVIHIEQNKSLEQYYNETYKNK